MLGQDFAANEIPHQHRHQRHRQRGAGRHSIGLGEGQRAEHAPFLRFQGEHRHEADGNDQQAEKQRRAYLGRRLGDDLPSVFGGERRAFQMLMHIFDHHNGAVDHGADGNGDTTQGHDVGVQTLPVHNDEGRQYPNRQADNGHQ